MNDSRDEVIKLTEREKARDVSVWFESRNNFLHPTVELLANATDEIFNNFSSGAITVILHKDKKTIEIIDTGRGIPIGDKKDGEYNYIALLLTLFAGTNYKNDENGKVTTGEHGLGLTVVNYTSTYFRLESNTKRYFAEIEFKDGGNIAKELKLSQQKEGNTGTRIIFKLDEEIFGDYEYDSEILREMCYKLAGSNTKITTIFKDETVGEEYKYHFDEFKDYFSETVKEITNEIIIGYKKEFNDENELNKLEIILATSTNPIQQSFLNFTYLKNGGTPNEGIIDGFKTFMNRYCKENKLLKAKEGSISNIDIEDSISFTCNILSVKSEFANQTKLSTKKKLYSKLTSKYVKELLEVYALEHNKEFKKIAEHIIKVHKFNSNAEKNKKNLKDKLTRKVDSFKNRIDDLVDCIIHDMNSELYIAEGKSALGSLVQGREDPNYQACYPIRGKTLSCLKTTIESVLANGVVEDLIRLLGCGIETKKKYKNFLTFNKENLRFGKIIFATDQDADGFNIQCLLLTIFYVLMPTLILDGHIYIVVTPLYEVKLSDDTMIYWYSEKERDEEISKYSNIVNISRCKGLGEVEAEIMNECAMNPKTRKLIQVTVKDIEEMDKAFKIWYGKDVKDRKKIIENELNKYLENLD